MTPEKLDELERLARAATEDWPFRGVQDYNSTHYYIQALNPQTCIELIEYIRKLQEPIWSVGCGLFAVENITIDTRFKFEQEIKELKAQLKTARADALREAAKECIGHGMTAQGWATAKGCEVNILALIDKPSAKEGAE